jgi:uncharacterized protein (DUF362 family)/Pyruvate/2-oxoacid:ferredoxin oxidoreductase delta subunit
MSTVALVRCDSYDDALVLDAVRRGLDLLGGVAEFVRSGERLILKPNVLAPSTPDKAVTTHPSVMKAVARVLLDAGARLSYGDAVGVPLLPSAMAMKRVGLSQVAEELGISPADFDHGTLVSFANGISSKKLFIAQALLDTDGVISLPKFKTHGLTRFTGAVKNQFGCVPGMVKGEYHARFADPTEFAGLLADITAFVNPRLYVMDAIVAMEGNGPQSGDPVKMGLLLFSTDPVALDATCCRLIDLDPAFVPTTAAGEKAGLGTSDAAQIRLKGDPLESFVNKSFNVVRRPPARLLQNKFVARVRNHTTRRPVIIAAKCTKCGMCVKMCPVQPKAVQFARDDKSRPPSYDYSRCIRCFCCHEACPSQAIVIKRPLLGRVLPPLAFAALLAVRIASGRENRRASAAGRQRSGAGR